MMEGSLILIFICIAIVLGGASLRKMGKSWGSIAVFYLYIFSLLVFAVGLLFHSHQYSERVDPVDGDCYIPFGGVHIISILVYFVLYHASAILIWIKGRKLPPLVLVLSMIFLMIGIVIQVVNILQFSVHIAPENEQYDLKESDGIGIIFVPVTLFSIGIAIGLIAKIIESEKELSENRVYKNSFLHKCNTILSEKFSIFSWSIILLLPVFVFITLILILFGQDLDSLVKVYIETSTWAFSQKKHPPILDHTGHYLCTVSAKGSPNLVKPIHIGKRHGNPIIVNRQLQIANAFEEMLSDFSPKIHHWIRRNYDRYGYNLSLKINSEKRSNITYVLMKPLEWFFLLCLYFFCIHPEKKIRKQYVRNEIEQP